MVIAHEVGVAHRLAIVPVTVKGTEIVEQIIAVNPFGKIPTLLLDDGTAIYDSPVICEYLDGLHEGRRMFPAAREARLQALRNQATGDAMMDTLIVWLGETMRAQPDHSAPRIVVCQHKIGKALDRLEVAAPALAATLFDIGHAAIGTALSYMDFRFAPEGWRSGRPGLAAWYDSFAVRPSAKATEFYVETAAPVATTAKG